MNQDDQDFRDFAVGIFGGNREPQPHWTARCKSGYTFGGKPCRRICSRGELLCGDCRTAVVVPDLPRLRRPVLAVMAFMTASLADRAAKLLMA